MLLGMSHFDNNSLHLWNHRLVKLVVQQFKWIVMFFLSHILSGGIGFHKLYPKIFCPFWCNRNIGWAWWTMAGDITVYFVWMILNVDWFFFFSHCKTYHGYSPRWDLFVLISILLSMSRSDNYSVVLTQVTCIGDETFGHVFFLIMFYTFVNVTILVSFLNTKYFNLVIQ